MSKTAIAKSCWFMCIIVLLTISGCAKELENGGASMLTPADLLPGDDDISGWGSVGAYEEIKDYDGLYDINDMINGEAEVFIEEGFVSMAFQIYENCIGETSIMAAVHLRIYDQGSAENAWTLYDRIATGIGIPWDGAGAEARIDERAFAAYTIEFCQRNFFVQVIIEDKTDEALSIAKLFAARVSDEIR